MLMQELLPTTPTTTSTAACSSNPATPRTPSTPSSSSSRSNRPHRRSLRRMHSSYDVYRPVYPHASAGGPGRYAGREDDGALTSDPRVLEEIQLFAEEKKRMVMEQTIMSRAEEEQWRASIRQQMESELDRRVREALDPIPAPTGYQSLPGETSGAQKDGSGRDLAELEQLNAHIHLDLTEKEQEYIRSKRWKVLQAKRKIRRLMSQDNMQFAATSKQELSVNPDYLITHMAFDPDSDMDYAGLFGFDGPTTTAKTQAHYAGVVKKALTNFGALSTAERHEFFYAFTRNGFKEALRTGRLPDGSALTDLGGGKYKDKHGIVRDEHGPFWPPDHGPLFPTPTFTANSLPFEPMTNEDTNKGCPTFDTQTCPYPNKWRGVQIVYDSEKSAKDFDPPPVTEGYCPSLLFESRFESGNLRQARRTGQFEYELVLKTDLYTNRHTQWYYFRVKNAVPGITYKFKIINLLKRDSLYNHGMRPIIYSEKNAKQKKLGWTRVGHHINYTRNIINLQCPLLNRERAYYMLEWQLEFPNDEDTCYLAHCYPYTYTDLKDHLDELLLDKQRSKVMHREVMCETKAGNSCFLVTVTNFDEKDEERERAKKLVIVSARVHPGETNASWMMKGLLDYITCSAEQAKHLRDKFIFKIVPMINPDGVIVGNYRCSLAARDLNRNYRRPRKEGFPTVWHIKEMMEREGKDREILMYCDLHGHSRKQNVFMYGCNTNKPPAPGAQVPSLSEEYLRDRLFPWLMSQKAPDKFSFRGCKFAIKRCKESTGRVVMFRQLNVLNSFTMEATFCGTTICKGERRHFNPRDYQSMGQVFCEVVNEYSQMQKDNSKQSDAVLELTRAITQQVLESRGLLPSTLPDISTEAGREQLKELSNNPNMTSPEELSTAFMKLVKTEYQNNLRNLRSSAPALTSDLPKDIRGGKQSDMMRQRTAIEIGSRLDVNKLVDSMSRQTIDGCVNLLEQLDVNSSYCESDSSDSDSESEPEMKYSDPKPRKKKRSKKKRNSQADIHKDERKKEKDSRDRPNSTSALPAITQDESQRKKKSQGSDMKRYVKQFTKNYPGYVNKYEGRSNGGIPCFSEERLIERAAKRMAEMKKRSSEDEITDDPSRKDDFFMPQYSSIGALGMTEEEYNRGRRSITQIDMHSSPLHPSFHSAMPPYIRTGYMHAEGGAIPEVSDNSSDDSESSDHENLSAAPMVSIAAMHSPYHNYNRELHQQHQAGNNNNTTSTGYHHQQMVGGLSGSGLTHTSQQQHNNNHHQNHQSVPALNLTLTPRVGSINGHRNSQGLRADQTGLQGPHPALQGQSGNPRLIGPRGRTFAAVPMQKMIHPPVPPVPDLKLLEITDHSRANPPSSQQQQPQHPQQQHLTMQQHNQMQTQNMMNRDYTDMLLQRLRSHNAYNLNVSASASQQKPRAERAERAERPERKTGERHATCE